MVLSAPPMTYPSIYNFHNNIGDFDMQCNEYLLVDFVCHSANVDELAAQTLFVKNCADYETQVRNSSLSQILLRLPYDWDFFSAYVEQLQYKPAIIRFSKMPQAHEQKISFKESTSIAEVERLVYVQQELHYDTFDAHFFQNPRVPHFKKYYQQLQNVLNSGNGKLYIIEENGAAIGYIMCEVNDSRSIYVFDLFVDEFYRGKGFGKALLHHAENYAVKIGAHKLCLNSSIANKNGIAFYRAYGLKEVSKTYYRELA